MPTTIRGAAAEVRWAYHVAAALGSWTLTAEGAGFVLTASVVSADAFRLSQPALTFRVPRQNGPAWGWPIQSLQVTGATLTATLGPQE